jgi:hypothetical protein
VPTTRSAATPAQDRVILSVTGAISGADGSGRIDFDLKDLEQLGLTKLTTWTPWTEGEVEFEGVRARRLMEAGRRARHGGRGARA